jgi:hypothetical protein
MDAERRFLLLLAVILCAAVALAAFGGRAAERWPVAAGRSQAAAQPSTARAVPFSPQAAFRPLLSNDAATRFGRLALALLPPQPVLAQSQIVSYYGSPYAPEMGILGTDDPETLAARLAELAGHYDQLNGALGVVPALHLVYGVAQYHPTTNGLYLQYADDADVRRYLEVAIENDMLLFLDLQIGRSSVEQEISRVLPFLRHPDVHLAIDPEFAVRAGEVPGRELGSLRASDIDRAQAALQRLVDEAGLPPKLLVVHQFADSMVPDGEAIRRYPGVELIIDVDGFGLAAVKRATYLRYAVRSYAAHAAIKLFFDHDPDLMSAEDVLLLRPRPAIIIYQ